MAIGRPELATADDDTLEEAHDAHMQMMQDMTLDGEKAPANPFQPDRSGSTVKGSMPPGPAHVVPGGRGLDNEKQVAAYREGLIRETMKNQDLSNEDARKYVRTLLPELFPVIKLGRSAQEIAAEEQRRDDILKLVNEHQERLGIDYDNAFGRVRRDNPELFSLANEKGKGRRP